MIQQQPAPSQYFFTELSLICGLLNQELKQSKEKLAPNHLLFHTNEEGDISTILVKVSETNSKGSAWLQINVRITVIQIQTCIKFHIVYSRNLYESREKSQKSVEAEEDMQRQILGQMQNHSRATDKPVGILQQQFQYIDEFWINYKNYLPKRIYQAYHVSEFEGKGNIDKINKLKIIFNERIINQIAFLVELPTNNQAKQQNKSPSIAKMDNKTLLITAVAQNYSTLCRYLLPKQYKNLCICNRQIYKILTNQQNYKVLFEQKWGRTGFELDQKDWIKMYKNKILAQFKSKSMKGGSRTGFYWV